MTTPIFNTPEAVESLRPDIHVFPPEDLISDALIISSTTKVVQTAGDAPVVRAPFIDVDAVDFIPEGDKIPAAPIDSREAVIATGALAVITDDFRHQVFVHDQLVAVGLAVETDAGRRRPAAAARVRPGNPAASSRRVPQQ